jgi:MOSC domain-containing protein YiiM
MHLDLSALEAGLDEIRQSPIDHGTVELIVRRPADDQRETLTEAHLDPTAGLVGDVWLSEDADPSRQVTVMNARVIALLAQSRERWPLAGDQLYVDLDLSGQHLPPGTRLEVGSAVLEVTAEPHRGCKKFAARFGLDALRFVNSNIGYALSLRGINTRVVHAGVVRPGDTIRRLQRFPAEHGVIAPGSTHQTVRR